MFIDKEIRKAKIDIKAELNRLELKKCKLERN
jgi:hypothetical protein